MRCVKTVYKIIILLAPVLHVAKRQVKKGVLCQNPIFTYIS